MAHHRPTPLVALAVLLVATLAAGCTTTGNTGNVRGGAGSGWENFRAEAPLGEPVAALPA